MLDERDNLIAKLRIEIDSLSQNERDYSDLNFLLTNLEHRYNLLSEEKHRMEQDYNFKEDSYIKQIAIHRADLEQLRQDMNHVSTQNVKLKIQLDEKNQHNQQLLIEIQRNINERSNLIQKNEQLEQRLASIINANLEQGMIEQQLEKERMEFLKIQSESEMLRSTVLELKSQLKQIENDCHFRLQQLRLNQENELYTQKQVLMQNNEHFQLKIEQLDKQNEILQNQLLFAQNEAIRLQLMVQDHKDNKRINGLESFISNSLEQGNRSIISSNSYPTDIQRLHTIVFFQYTAQDQAIYTEQQEKQEHTKQKFKPHPLSTKDKVRKNSQSIRRQEANRMQRPTLASKNDNLKIEKSKAQVKQQKNQTIESEVSFNLAAEVDTAANYFGQDITAINKKSQANDHINHKCSRKYQYEAIEYIQELETQLEDYMCRLDKTREDNDTLKVRLIQAQEEAINYELEIKKLRDEIKNLEAERDQKFKELEKQINQLRLELSNDRRDQNDSVRQNMKTNSKDVSMETTKQDAQIMILRQNFEQLEKEYQILLKIQQSDHIRLRDVQNELECKNREIDRTIKRISELEQELRQIQPLEAENKRLKNKIELQQQQIDKIVDESKVIKEYISIDILLNLERKKQVQNNIRRNNEQISQTLWELTGH